MSFRSIFCVVTVTLVGLVPFIAPRASQSASEDECARTASSQVYSNAVFVEEAGDVVGFELAFQQRDGHSVKALLYDCEGAPNEESISVSGQVSRRKVTMEGNWIQHLIEEPSKKEIVETHPVQVSGTLDPKRFRGTIKISGVATPVTMKRVDQIWTCRR